VSKRDDDGDLGDVGMTTAERRRRRRRGALRVPSDNVPRTRAPTSPPVVAPVPEDPALAMSIAYSFNNEPSEPVPRSVFDEPSRRNTAGLATQPASAPAADPNSPTVVSSVIDPPSAPVEQADFEMKTREMAAVDLEALGLDARTSSAGIAARENGNASARSPVKVIVDDELRVTMRQQERSATDVSEVEVDVSMDATTLETAADVVTEADDNDNDEKTTISVAPPPPPPSPSTTVPPPLPPAASSASAGTANGPATAQITTVVPAQAAPAPPPSTPPLGVPSRAKPNTRERLKTMALTEEDLEEVMEAARASTRPGDSQRSATPAPAAIGEDVRDVSTQPLGAVEIEVADGTPAERGSGEIDIDVDVASAESAPVMVIEEQSDRSTKPSVPPPVVPTRASPPPRAGTAPIAAAPVATDRDDARGAKAKDGTGDAKPAKPDGHAVPPPPPPSAEHRRHAPPTPPPPLKKAPPPPSAAGGKSREPRGKPWFVDLFDEDYLRTLPFLTPQATQAEAEFVIETMGLSPGAQLLDVGCGYGRHAMELAARGYHVVGLDLSTPLLVRGGEEAHRRNLTINFVRGDMRELDFEAQFDGAYCLFSTFGYFDDETNKKALANIARALRPGGRVLVEILNRDYVIADLPTRVWWEGDGCVVLEEVDLNYFSSRIQVNRSVVFDDGRQLEQEISLRAYSLHEVGKLMHAAGFRVLEVSGGYQTRGRFFGNQSRHIIVLAERKDPVGSTTGTTTPVPDR
jgi:SAM-dependent methyltransferase